MTQGPQAVTLKAVADAMGTSHVNVLHHFGSAAGLQSALMEGMVRDLAQALTATSERVREGELPLSDLLDQVFEAFGQGGAGRLAAWMSLTGALGELDPVQAVVRQLNEALAAQIGLKPDVVSSAVLLAALVAVGDALVGDRMEAMLDQPSGGARRATTRAIAALIAAATADASAIRP
jgi:TetR/AcrR family transcriptional regulator, repressor for neighboring sulfatase